MDNPELNFIRQVQQQPGIRGKLVIFIHDEEKLTPYQMIVESAKKAGLDTCVKRSGQVDGSQCEHLIQIGDEIIVSGFAENNKNAKEVLGPKALQSLQETCFTITVKKNMSGQMVHKVDMEKMKFVDVSDDAPVKDKIYPFLEYYATGPYTHKLMFHNEFSEEEKKLIFDSCTKLQLKSKLYDKNDKWQLTVLKKMSSWDLVEKLLTKGNVTENYSLQRPTDISGFWKNVSNRQLKRPVENGSPCFRPLLIGKKVPSCSSLFTATFCRTKYHEQNTVAPTENKICITNFVPSCTVTPNVNMNVNANAKRTMSNPVNNYRKRQRTEYQNHDNMNQCNYNMQQGNYNNTNYPNYDNSCYENYDNSGYENYNDEYGNFNNGQYNNFNQHYNQQFSQNSSWNQGQFSVNEHYNLQQQYNMASKNNLNLCLSDTYLLNRVRKQQGCRGKLILFHNSVGNLTTYQMIVESAQKSNMDVHLKRTGQVKDNLSEFVLQIVDETIVSDFAESNKQARDILAPKAWSVLQQNCFTVMVKTHLKGRNVDRSEIDFQTLEEDNYDEQFRDSKSMKMMRSMGWTGRGLGRVPYRQHPLKFKENLRHFGFNYGKENCLDEFQNKLMKYLENYVQNSCTYNLVFSNQFTIKERKVIHEAALKMKLKSKSFGKAEMWQIVISKKLSPWELVEHLLASRDQNPNYILIRPTNVMLYNYFYK